MDVLLIGLHVTSQMTLLLDSVPVAPWRLNVNIDRSFGEIGSYARWVAAALALGFAWSRSGQAIYGAMALFCLVVVADDMLQLHETGGGLLVPILGLEARLGLRAQDFGELVIWAGLGTITLGILVPGYLRSNAHGRSDGMFLFVLLALLVFFVVALDLAAIAAQSLQLPGLFVWLLSVAEDGGEMVVASFYCAAAISIAAAWRKRRLSVRSRARS